MSQSLNLKELERLAFRRTYQDGLYDIYIGGMFASFAAFGFTIFPGGETESLTTLLYYLVGVGLSGLVFWLGKKYFTLPRIGLVNFGPARQKRRRDLFLALAVIVAVQVLVVLLQFTYLQSPAVREWLAPRTTGGLAPRTTGGLAPLLGQINSSSLPVAIAAVIFVAPGMLLIAYKAEIPLGYYHAVVMASAIFLMILLDQAWWMVLGGVLILIPGLVQFVRFLRRYPLEKITDERR